MAAEPQSRGVSGPGQRAAAAAVQPVFSKTLPEPVDPADRVRTDRAECGACRRLQARSRGGCSGKCGAGGNAAPSRSDKTGGRTLSPDLAEAGAGQGKRAAAAAAGALGPLTGRSGLRRARRAHDAGSPGHPERDARGIPAARPLWHRHRRPRGDRDVACTSGRGDRGAAGTFQQRPAGADFQARPTLALFHEPRHRRTGVHRDAGDRPRPGRGRGLCLAHAQQRVPLSIRPDDSAPRSRLRRCS